jgi:4-aminobutyrate aminotransferase-like enzyme
VLECGEATIRLCPPLIVDEAAVDTAIRLFGEAIAAADRPIEGIGETGG